MLRIVVMVLMITALTHPAAADVTGQAIIINGDTLRGGRACAP